jgi:hypothetical protein
MVVAPLYTFIDSPEWLRISLFATFCFFMALASVLMVVALLKIRSRFLSQGKGEQISPLRMVIHASAFLVYVGMYIILAFLESSYDTTDYTEYYFSWSVDIVFGAISYVCLFFVLWHLGKKIEEIRTETVNSDRTISINSNDEDDEMVRLSKILKPDLNPQRTESEIS